MKATNPLPEGSPDDDYPINDMTSPTFKVGGVKRTLPPEKQLEQLTTYIDATYELPSFKPPWKGGDGNPDPADRYISRLPDRITHASMLMLGSAIDHTMPGVAFAGDVHVDDVPEVGGAVFRPSQPTGRWALSFHSGGWWRGSGEALEHQWRPEVAAAAELSGTTILDLDHPLAPQHTLAEINAAVARACEWVTTHNPTSITAWGYSSGGALATLNATRVDALALTFPDLDSVAGLPEDIAAGQAVPAVNTWPRTLVQVALQDEIASRPAGIDDASQVEVQEYVSTHRVSTPAVARQRIQDLAAFLRTVD